MSAQSENPVPDETSGLAIVILGHFNPSIFSPGWMRHHNLLGKREADEAKVQMIVPPAAIFSTDWLQVQVVENRLSFGTAMPQEFDRLRDAVVGTMTILSQTPVFALGTNFEHHWTTPSLEAYHAFGDALVPKGFWGEHLDLPGLQDLTIRGVRPDGWDGWIDVTVQPSLRLRPHGIYSRVNDHVILSKAEHPIETRADFSTVPTLPEASTDLISDALGLLRDEWSARIQLATQITRSIQRLSQSFAEPM